MIVAAAIDVSRVCPSSVHEAMKLDDATWARLICIGSMPTYNDEPGSPQILEMRNCHCGSTLCKELP